MVKPFTQSSTDPLFRIEYGRSSGAAPVSHLQNHAHRAATLKDWAAVLPRPTLNHRRITHG